MKIAVQRWQKLSRAKKEKLLSRSEIDISAVSMSVQVIIDAVRERGDEALLQFTKQFEGADLEDKPFLVPKEDFDRAEEALDRDVKEALEFAIGNVKRFHEVQKPRESSLIEIAPGVLAGERPLPIPSAGLYVPRGRGSFPSMLYMLAVPAVVAGVKRICVATPPAGDGSVDPACLYAARLCGVKEVFRIGGAQAIAAFAFGTESVPKLDKVVGPGSMYVAAAKRLLSGVLDTGLPAGPSESMVLADGKSDPHKVTLDLLIEAEHGSDSAALLVTPDSRLAHKVARLIPEYTEKLPEPRRTFVRDVFTGYGAVVLTETIEEAAAVVNDFAPEHLQIQTEQPWETLSLIENAGEILLGDNTPFSLANYAVGANAVLPTGGKAKSFSAVSVRDFIKYSSLVHLTRQGYESMKDKVVTLAQYEGFPSHARALTDREL
jgi:histidinol dehydrogenase